MIEEEITNKVKQGFITLTSIIIKDPTLLYKQSTLIL